MIRNICNYQKKIKKILKLHNNGYTVEIHYSVNKKKKKKLWACSGNTKI